MAAPGDTDTSARSQRLRPDPGPRRPSQGIAESTRPASRGAGARFLVSNVGHGDAIFAHRRSVAHLAMPELEHEEGPQSTRVVAPFAPVVGEQVGQIVSLEVSAF